MKSVCKQTKQFLLLFYLYKNFEKNYSYNKKQNLKVKAKFWAIKLKGNLKDSFD